MFKKRKKFWIGGLILLVAAVFLGYRGFASSATYYYTVSEAIGKGNAIYGETVRVNGLVETGSVEQQASSLKFNVTEGTQSLPVVYQGVVPDSFKAGNEIVIEGRLNSSGLFQADVLMPKCPSKYEPAK